MLHSVSVIHAKVQKNVRGCANSPVFVSGAQKGLFLPEIGLLKSTRQYFVYVLALVLFSVAPASKFNASKAMGNIVKKPRKLVLFSGIFLWKQALHMQIQYRIEFAPDFHTLLIFRVLNIPL